jgi:hypothetical protein
MSTLSPILLVLEMLVFVLGMFGLTAYYKQQLFEDDEGYGWRWLLAWMGKGVLLPVIAWVALNAGWHPIIPPLHPMQLPAITGRLDALVFEVRYVSAQTAPALFVISSYWAALTFGWWVWATSPRARDRAEFIASCVAWCALLSPVVALLIYVCGPGAIGLALLTWFCPLAHHALSFKPVKTQPAYAHAVASLKFGKYHQAEQAIIGELEKCESDFDGWLMLAELYATQFHDLAEAERTIHGLCDDPATTLAQVSVALNRLADWQLRFRQDPDAARRALEEIRRRAPGTHLAKMAELRMKQLPATSAEWKEQHQARIIQLPPLGDKLDEAAGLPAPKINQAAALAQARQCVEKLEANPADIATREKLAGIFAEQLGETGLAVDQIESLMELPGQPPEKMAAWLALIAAWEIRRGGDRQAARKHLERLVHEYPRSVQALAARRRLDLLDREGDARNAPPPADAPRLTIDGAR